MTATLWYLASLACEAAIELDNYSLGRECNELAAVAKLVEWLTKNVPTREQMQQPDYVFCGQLFVIMNRLSKQYGPIGPTVGDVLSWVYTQVDGLRNQSVIDPIYWRTWALKLSRIACAQSAYRRRW